MIEFRDVAERVYTVLEGVTDSGLPPRWERATGPLGLLMASGDRFRAASELRATGMRGDALIAEAAEEVAAAFFRVMRAEGSAPSAERVFEWDRVAAEGLLYAMEELL